MANFTETIYLNRFIVIRIADFHKFKHMQDLEFLYGLNPVVCSISCKLGRQHNTNVSSRWKQNIYYCISIVYLLCEGVRYIFRPSPSDYQASYKKNKLSSWIELS
jgi:hypothetical protein